MVLSLVTVNAAFTPPNVTLLAWVNPLPLTVTGVPTVPLVTLRTEVAYRRGNYEAARGYIQTVTPAFTRKDVEAYQKRAFESLKAALNKPSPRS